VKSAFAFMITSILSEYKDVVHVLPTCKIDGKDLQAIPLSKELSGVSRKLDSTSFLSLQTTTLLTEKQCHSLLSHLNFLFDTPIIAIQLVPCFSCLIPCTF